MCSTTSGIELSNLDLRDRLTAYPPIREGVSSRNVTLLMGDEEFDKRFLGSVFGVPGASDNQAMFKPLPDGDRMFCFLPSLVEREAREVRWTADTDLEPLARDVLVYEATEGLRRLRPGWRRYLLRATVMRSLRSDDHIVVGLPKPRESAGVWLVGSITLRSTMDGCLTGVVEYLDLIEPWIEALRQEAGPAWDEEAVTSAKAELWSIIPDGWERDAVRMWHGGRTKPEIAKRHKKETKTVENRFSELRKTYGVDVVPYRQPPNRTPEAK
jgi:hypothetical protein